METYGKRVADTTQVLEHFLTSGSIASGLLLLGRHFNSTIFSIIDSMAQKQGISDQPGVLGFWGFGVLE